MPDQVTPFEYIDKAFGYNLVQAFNIDPDYMPQQIKSFLERPQNKKIYFGGIEKQGAKAFRTMVEKRSADKKIIPSPLIVVHREVGSTTDEYQSFNETLQYKDILQAFKAQVIPKTFSFTIQIFARNDQREILDILSTLIDVWMYEHYSLTIPHVVKWTENQTEEQEEMNFPLDISLTDIQNPSWTPVIDGHYLGIENGKDVKTQIIVSNMITPSIIDFNFVGVESL